MSRARKKKSTRKPRKKATGKRPRATAARKGRFLLQALQGDEARKYTVGTSEQGTIETTYSQIKSRFGQPSYDTHEPGEKVSHEWVLRFPNGKTASIYDYKTNPVYDSDNSEEYGIADPYTATKAQIDKAFKKYRTKKIEWSIGGKSKEAVDLVNAAFAGKLPKEKSWKNLWGLIDNPKGGKKKSKKKARAQVDPREKKRALRRLMRG